jgi:hypothetical protein
MERQSGRSWPYLLSRVTPEVKLRNFGLLSFLLLLLALDGGRETIGDVLSCNNALATNAVSL